MKPHFTALIFTITSLLHCGQNNPVKVSPVFGYHEKFGIPKATLIRQIEENSDQTSNVSQRIVGGTITDISDIPYQVGVLITIQNDMTSLCGGSLISNNRILTAAHCITDGMYTAQMFIAVLGSNTLFMGGLRVVTTDVEVHPEWLPETAENDIAVLKIPYVTFTATIQPISLPVLNSEFDNENGLTSGYGTTSNGNYITTSQVLYSIVVSIISNEECFQVYGPWVHSSVICTSGESGIGTCGGDSGGPLAVSINSEKVLVGITSFGDEDCASGYPSAYTRVTSFLPWITSIL